MSLCYTSSGMDEDLEHRSRGKWSCTDVAVESLTARTDFLFGREGPVMGWNVCMYEVPAQGKV